MPSKYKVVDVRTFDFICRYCEYSKKCVSKKQVILTGKLHYKTNHPDINFEMDEVKTYTETKIFAHPKITGTGWNKNTI